MKGSKRAKYGVVECDPCQSKPADSRVFNLGSVPAEEYVLGT